MVLSCPTFVRKRALSNTSSSDVTESDTKRVKKISVDSSHPMSVDMGISSDSDNMIHEQNRPVSHYSSTGGQRS